MQAKLANLRVNPTGFSADNQQGSLSYLLLITPQRLHAEHPYRMMI